MVPTALAAVVYSIGVPAFFLYLVFKFKERGQRGDKTVQNALGWLYEPFRAGEVGPLARARRAVAAAERAQRELEALVYGDLLTRLREHDIS